MEKYILKKYNSIKDINSNEWNNIVSEEFFQMKHEYLKSLENNCLNNFKYFYIVIYNNEQLVASTVFYNDKKFSFKYALYGKYRKLYSLFNIKFNALFCGSPVSEHNAINILNEYKNDEHCICDLIIDELNIVSKQLKCDVTILKDHYHKCMCSKMHGFTQVNHQPGTYIYTKFNTFDNYLISLKKKWRANIRNKINNKEDELDIKVINPTRDVLEKAYFLYLQTYKNAKEKHDLLSLDFFIDCMNNLEDRSKLLVAFIKDNLIGFAQLVETDNYVINVRMGMDYKFNSKYNLYFHMLYENINYCIKANKEKLYLSQTAYRPKLELGAKLIPLYSYIKFNNKIINLLLRKILIYNFNKYKELSFSSTPHETYKLLFPNNFK